MNAVILKYSVKKGNYWGNEAYPNGVGIQTLRSITQAVVDVANSNGSIYVCRVGRAPEFFGPMSCSPEIVYEGDYFYRLRLTGNLVNRAIGFLKSEAATRVQRALPTSEGVLVQKHTVRPFLFWDEQPPELRLSPPFILIDPA